MLNQQDNEFLSRIGRGTPMGDLVRQYWIPALQSHELATPDGLPLRLRLLGENLIAFRTESGRIGIVQNACPHRGASLFFGRNEEEGLRCVYHGWKFDVEGNCVDQLCEPEELAFTQKVKITAYPTIERNGVVWAYMGPRELPPPLWDLEFNVVPEGQYRIGMNLRECNWVQAIEGGIDSAHSAILHSTVDADHFEKTGEREFIFSGRRHQPLHYDVRVAEAGVIGAAYRQAAEPGNYWWRMNIFLMPFYTMFPGSPDGTLSGHAFVPIDDENTMCWNITWNPGRTLSLQGRGGNRGGFAGADDGGYLPDTSDWLGRWRMAANSSNDYKRDPEAERTKRYSGIVSINLQDSGIQESMGPIIDRTQEHLGSVDALIIQMRRRLMQSARSLLEGESPAEVDDPQYAQLRALQMILPKDRDWMEVGGDWIFGRASEPPVESQFVNRPAEPPVAAG
jgi:nitrite reductase/ring-hydroxylating ferredoxin subunit